MSPDLEAVLRLWVVLWAAAACVSLVWDGFEHGRWSNVAAWLTFGGFLLLVGALVGLGRVVTALVGQRSRRRRLFP